MIGRNADDCIIDAGAIRTLIARHGLKQWWIADQLRVHRKTVSRWVNGAVRRTSYDTIVALAALLRASVDEITIDGEADRFASVQDQKAAAGLLRRSELLDRLGPIGEWETIEKLLRTALVPGLSADTSGDLLNKLSIAAWRQGKIALAADYARKAASLAEEAGDEGALISARLNLANIASWRGEIPRALYLYRQCIETPGRLEPRRHAGALSNYAAVLWEAGEISGAIPPMTRAIEIYEQTGRPMNLSIAHAQMAMIRLEQEKLEVADAHIRRSANYAEAGEYRRGVCFAILLRAELDGAAGRLEPARQRVRQGLDGFVALDILEGRNFEIAARALRRVGELEEAEALVEQGLAAARGFAMEQGALELERGRILLASGVRARTRAGAAFRRARALYAACGAPRRASFIDTLTAAVTEG